MRTGRGSAPAGRVLAATHASSRDFVELKKSRLRVDVVVGSGRLAMRSHILVVDDTDSMRMLAVRHLEREGYRVTALGSATEVLEHVRNEIPDLIVSDIMMPEMSGYDLLERLRADPR